MQNRMQFLMARIKSMLMIPFGWLIIIALMSASIANECPKHPNKYGLPIVYCKEVYEKQVLNNPNFELVDLERSINGIVLDIRYATTNNFTKQKIYSQAKAYVRKPVFEALKKVQDSLASHHLGLKIFDGYRPYTATEKMYKIIPNPTFVANPRHGSRHNRGCSVDLTLINLADGKELQMPSDFDDFSEKAHPKYAKLPKEVIRNRSLLFNIMAHFGFTHNPNEWWHFDYMGWSNSPLMDLPFEVLGN